MILSNSLSDITVTASGSNKKLTISGMSEGKFFERGYLKLEMEMTRGSGALNHEPEAVALIVDQIRINHGRWRWSTNGRDVLIVENLKHSKRVGMNPQLSSADTEYILYIPIDPSPVEVPGMVDMRLSSDEVENCNINVTLLNPFDSTPTTGDVTSITINEMSLLVEQSSSGPEVPPAESLVFISESDFDGRSLDIKDVQPALVVIKSRSTFNTIDVNANGYLLDQAVTPLDLDAKDYKHQSEYRADETRETGGNQLLLAIPNADNTTEQWSKAFDIRNDKDGERPLKITLDTKSAQTEYIVVGGGQ